METSDIRKGVKIMMDGQPYVVIDFQFVKPGKGQAFTRTKMKNLLTGAGTETVFKADDKLEPIILERKEVTYSYFADPLYVFMDSDFNQYEIEKDDLEGVMAFIEDGMTDVCEAVFYNDRVISVELPTTIVRQIAYTEPAVRGDTSGKVMKVARLNNGAELQVSAFCEIGDSIEIDTLHHPERFVVAANKSAVRVEFFRDEVTHSIVAIVDDDLVGTGRECPFDRRVDFVGERVAADLHAIGRAHRRIDAVVHCQPGREGLAHGPGVGMLRPHRPVGVIARVVELGCRDGTRIDVAGDVGTAVTRIPLENVLADAQPDGVIPLLAVDKVVTIVASERVVAVGAEDRVVARTAID